MNAYEIYAIKYAHLERNAAANFLGGDPHDGPMPLDYFVWAVRGPQRTWIVDTGFDAEVGAQRQRNVIRSPAEGLKALGIDPDRIEDVIITHMHFDHCGNLSWVEEQFQSALECHPDGVELMKERVPEDHLKPLQNDTVMELGGGQDDE